MNYMRLVSDEEGQIPDAAENNGHISLLEENVCPMMLGGSVI
jgi:hypothetical protein